MEFSSSVDGTCKRSRRVRSWYLYEQFKSLERNQLDAAQKLKDKSYQERVLRQELNERRARRRLCDQFGLCQSESTLGRSVSNTPSKTLLSTSADDFYESFYRLHAEELNAGDTCSCDGSQSSKTYQECKPKYEDEVSNVDSITSVVENINCDDNLTDTIKEDIQNIQKNIAENINLQLETVKENIKCIEKYTKISDSDNISDADSFGAVTKSIKERKPIKEQIVKEYKSNVYTVLSVWSKLVEFSYRNMQLNYSGNCYNDYGTQLLVAILACDMLRRGINRMCYILQPYISPIKFAPSSPEIAKTYKNVKYINCEKQKTRKKELPRRISHKYNSIKRNYRSESKCHFIESKTYARKLEGMSEPWHSVARLIKSTEDSGSSIWPDNLKVSGRESICKCHKINCMVDSMMQLSHHLDNVLRDVQSVNCV